MKVFMLLLTALTLSACAGARPGAVSSGDPVRVLIIDGVSNHNWQLNTGLIRGIIEPTGLFEISVSTSPPRADSPGWDEWRPDFAAYDVVIQTYNDINGGPPWPAAVREDFEAYVRNGGGVFVYHSGNNAFADWDEYSRIIGLGWRRANQGHALMIDPEEGRIVRIPSGDGRGTGHGPRVDAVITRLDDHPIHQGLPREWKTPDIEVYYYPRGPAENVHVLSYTHDVQTDMHWPIEWTVDYGQGRVYTATYGHVWHDDTQPERMRCAGVQTVMVRALWWLAGRDEILPVPADFPTATEFSIRSEIQLPG